MIEYRVLNWKPIAAVVVALVVGFVLGSNAEEPARFTVTSAPVARLVNMGGHKAESFQTPHMIRTDTRTGRVEFGVAIEEQTENETKIAIAWCDVEDLGMGSPQAMAFLREYKRLQSKN